ncbi:MAG: ABC transporter ATP-binding protein [Planctomycetes bacterium]|nr:ABC transporter ATP-binding protein [Planctomycetota bacterium]
MAVAPLVSHGSDETAADRPLIELVDVCKSYRKGKIRINVLSNLDLTIERGRFISLLGPSGSGKSTLLNLLGGLDTADSGVVRVAGDDLTQLSEEQRTTWRSRNVGFVFQQYHLIPVLSAAENVEMPLRLFRMGRRERRRRVALALDLVGLADRAAHRPGQLSSGQEQRVAIARAFITDPKLILADEPTGDLDAENAEQITELLGVLSREIGKTIVMVTHDPRAAACASRELHLDKGVLTTPRGTRRPLGKVR